MAIRINTNVASLNSQRNLERSNQMLNKTLERLSSGLRINRAGDDAAGLAVANKLSTQVRGFTQAIANAQDASNLIATAETGLNQTTDILQRMRELSIQAASDTLVNKDRQKIQTEMTQLTQELDRIATNTQFNTRNLLDGTLQQGSAQEDATIEKKANIRVGGNDMLGAVAVGATVNTDAAYQFTILQADGVNTFTGVNGGFGTAATPAAGNYVLEARSSNGNAIAYYDLGATGNTQTVDLVAEFGASGLTASSGVASGSVVINASNLTADDVGKSSVVQVTAERAAVTDDKSLTFQVGANEGQFLRMGVQDMRAKALRLENLNIVGKDDSESRIQAQNAIGRIDQALDYVGTSQARIGAYQNRIDYAISNLQVARENLTASESRIRDADIAAETANLTRAQILVQAGTAVLTQANISPQSALNLL